LYTSELLELKGQRVVNTFDCTRVCGDKLVTSVLLKQAGIPHPRTWAAFTPEAALSLLEQLELPVVMKPVIGSWGRMVSKIESVNMGAALLEAHEVMGNIFQKVFYLQEFIPTPADGSAPTDIRVFYLGGECVAAMGRYRAGDDFRSNIALGGQAKPFEVTPEVEDICHKTAKAVGGEILGIDLMRGPNGYVCIEVNGVAGFAGIHKATGAPLGELIVKYLREEARC
jgi:[lysine-biosynthesis-protein LysW]--L-2-aminoadipate ligase